MFTIHLHRPTFDFMDHLEQKLFGALLRRRKENAYRSLPTEAKGIDFCSNDYLGLGTFPEKLPFEQFYPINGATGSRLISGNSKEALDLEGFLATFHHSDSALLFPSGYMANLGLLATVPQRGDTIIYDSYIHASLRDGISLSLARSFSFKHNNPEDLRQKLARAEGEIFIVVESLYSMDGDLAPLAMLCLLAAEHNAHMVVDEAHATGVYGSNGEGLVVAEGLQNAVWARIHTFGKAIGLHGATVVGPHILTEYLVNFCRPFIYTTALPAHICRQIKAHYSRLAKEPHLRDRLWNNIHHFQQLLIMKSGDMALVRPGPIQFFLCPGNEAVCQKAELLQSHGLDVLPIRHPTVPKGLERLRICIHAFNSFEELELLAGLLVGASPLAPPNEPGKPGTHVR